MPCVIVPVNPVIPCNGPLNFPVKLLNVLSRFATEKLPKAVWLSCPVKSVIKPSGTFRFSAKLDTSSNFDIRGLLESSPNGPVNAAGTAKP